MGAPRIVLIAGPTASGKSALALALAERLGGTVINADAMQVYRELRIITARPSAADEARVPHRLYGDVPAHVAWSAGRWLEAAKAEIAGALALGRVAIVAGGTGLYLKALTEGLSELPPIPDSIRAFWREKALIEPPEMLYQQLHMRDPETAAKLKPSDPQRIVRALEVMEATGRGLAEWQRAAHQAPDPMMRSAVRVRLMPDRSWLAQRIAARTGDLISDEGVDEVRRLLDLKLDPTLPAMKAIGVAEIGAMLAGDIDRAGAVDQIARNTSRYAKRQMTWLRTQMPDWTPLDPSSHDLVEEAARHCVQS